MRACAKVLIAHRETPFLHGFAETFEPVEVWRKLNVADDRGDPDGSDAA